MTSPRCRIASKRVCYLQLQASVLLTLVEVALIPHSLNSQPWTASGYTPPCDLELKFSENVSYNNDVSLVPDRSDCTAGKLWSRSHTHAYHAFSHQLDRALAKMPGSIAVCPCGVDHRLHSLLRLLQRDCPIEHPQLGGGETLEAPGGQECSAQLLLLLLLGHDAQVLQQQTPCSTFVFPFSLPLATSCPYAYLCLYIYIYSVCGKQTVLLVMQFALPISSSLPLLLCSPSLSPIRVFVFPLPFLFRPLSFSFLSPFLRL